MIEDGVARSSHCLHLVPFAPRSLPCLPPTSSHCSLRFSVTSSHSKLFVGKNCYSMSSSGYSSLSCRFLAVRGKGRIAASSSEPYRNAELGSDALGCHLEVQQVEEGWETKLIRIGEMLSTAFPLWVALACAAALWSPHAFLWIRGAWQITGLTLTMLGMGMTISLDDIKGALAMPKELLAGVVLQYTVMPTAGAFIGHAFGLPTHYAVGVILVACCPGGTASNVVTYLARGHVALSVLMTSASTFLAVTMTPLLTARLAGQYVAVDAIGLFASTVQVVLLPVLTGTIMAHYFPKAVRKVASFSPLVAIISVAALCASAVAQNAQAILSSGGQVLVAVSALHIAGFLFGYLLSQLLGFNSSISRTISIEVGMQNSVLGVVLANQHFNNPLTAVPCAVSSVCHSIIGSILAAFWSHTPKTVGANSNMS